MDWIALRLTALRVAVTSAVHVIPRLHDNRFDKRLNVCINDITGCETGCETGLTTGCIV